MTEPLDDATLRKIVAERDAAKAAFNNSGDVERKVPDDARGELLACPFCGSEAVDRRKIDGFPMIYCNGDDCFGPQTTAMCFDDAIKQWNTRAAPVPQCEAEPVAKPMCSCRASQRDGQHMAWCKAQ